MCKFFLPLLNNSFYFSYPGSGCIIKGKKSLPPYTNDITVCLIEKTEKGFRSKNELINKSLDKKIIASVYNSAPSATVTGVKSRFVFSFKYIDDSVQFATTELKQFTNSLFVTNNAVKKENIYAVKKVIQALTMTAEPVTLRSHIINTSGKPVPNYFKSIKRNAYWIYFSIWPGKIYLNAKKITNTMIAMA